MFTFANCVSKVTFSKPQEQLTKVEFELVKQIMKEQTKNV